MLHHQDTIVALSTAQGEAAIAVIRLSGSKAIEIASKLFRGKHSILDSKTHRAYFGQISFNGEILDEVVCTVFKGPHTYTGEDIVEISCHGSNYICSQIIDACAHLGARSARAGEFTQRAFMNGKLDLSQAEAVADLIASDNKAQHKIALQNLRGGFSNTLKQMREQLINFAALIELELDFSEEDVAFADRTKLLSLLDDLLTQLQQLAQSFKLGNAIKKGIPVAIVGKPNAGKSTLLNALLQEDKAIVSDIAGTTRDAIEDTININGISYRFIDTAGLRETSDTIEEIGIQKTKEKITSAQIILLVCDVAEDINDIVAQASALALQPDQQLIIVLNKVDLFKHGICNAYDVEEAVATLSRCITISISAKQQQHLQNLIKALQKVCAAEALDSNQIIISNTRHYDSIIKTIENLSNVKQGLQAGLSGDLITIDLRHALHTLGTITGSVEIDRDILGTVFSKFCIGK